MRNLLNKNIAEIRIGGRQLFDLSHVSHATLLAETNKELIDLMKLISKAQQ